MSRLVLDSVNFAALASTRWPHLIGYANGRISAWTPAQIKQTRQRGQLLALVDVLGNAPREASILDFERGDVTSPAVVREWARARNQFADDATVYCSPRSIPTVVGGLRGEKCNLFVVDLTDDGEPPFTVPHYPGLPGNVRVIMRQFVFGPRSGGDYDMSICYADNFHPEQVAPARLFAARAAAAAELGPYQNATSAAEIISPATGQIAGHLERPEQLTIAEQPEQLDAPERPFQVMTLPEPFGATLPCDGCPGPAACAAAGRCLEPGGADDVVDQAAAHVDQAAAHVDQAAADVAGAAVVASTAPDSVDPAAEHQAAEQAATARQLGIPAAVAEANAAAFADDLRMAAARTEARRLADLTDEELIAEHIAATSGPADGGAAAAGISTAAAAAAQSPLNHEFIRATLADAGKVAAMFRAGGWHTAAAELERAAAAAWELGSALKSAGL